MWLALGSAAAQPSAQSASLVAHKSAHHATTLSVIGTLSGLGMMYFSAKYGDAEGDVMKGFAGAFMVIGPAWGEWWVADRIVFTPGMGLRLAGFGIGTLALGSDRDCNAIARMTGGGAGCAPSTKQTANDSMLELGLALGVAGVLYDVVDAGRQARMRRFMVVPAVTPTYGGLGVAASF